ncbi:Xaa-Pro aminopeptidase [Methylococcus sp. EFPC2]|uniref:Xaa-Pro aminopeptidase n=1 Tax=Methylococcus sp. EFPC2 TaxID=2812648 RepID=UPI001967B1A7|nr:Xaa-Pro aminopeptidase [Methylococcus sp. EFPC2]QSA96678.1 Xaa-Pro aminopeptidase [Methylococcus sp. EFPC2]
MTISSEFKQRRKHLMRRMKKRSLALIAAAPAARRNRDAEYPYRQNSDFYYLTGFNEPDAVAVFIPGREQGEFILFCREYDETMAIWTGRHAGLDGAREQFGADEAHPIGKLDEVLPSLMDGRERLYYPLGDEGLRSRISTILAALRERARAGVRPPSALIDLDGLVHEMRLFKSPAELASMRRAMEVSAAAHRRAMRICRPGLREYEIEAELLHEFTRQGLRSPAYSSIVAGGNNACVLHYIHNEDVLQDGDLLLIDAGAECDNYAADITRTFPVNGRFTAPQRQLYELVLDAQAAAIASIRPGRRWNEPHEAAVQVLTKGLVKLGLLRGRVAKLIHDEAYKKFYMHRTGHWLGMDVHDVGDYKAGDDWRVLEPGMVLTVEPGLYVSESCADVEEHWRGIGIRIEDDVLVTEKGCEVLTAAVPKSVADIEALMRAEM